MQSRGPALQASVLDTLRICADIVGSTLGPGGRSVLIEHQDPAMPPINTKDGVTVFRSLGFQDPTKQVLMEAARDASLRTASEAGDGTTTATILAEAFARKIAEFCQRNPHVSPQRVGRVLQKLLRQDLLPRLEAMKYKPEFGTEEGYRTLEAVATVSANGDVDLARAVMSAFRFSGDAGNVTITEANGPSSYIVQKIEGYPVPIGYEDSCGPFYQKFVNDIGTQQCLLEKPSFVLYFGRINDFNTVFPALAEIANTVSDGRPLDDGTKITHNVILVATGFSESVLANLAAGFVQQGTLNIYPLLVPPSPLKTGQFDFLMDLAALTNGTILDPIENPLQNFQLSHLGVGPKLFEASRFRSNIIGRNDDLLVLERVDQISKQLSEAAVSELERTFLKERLAKLTSGIAKIVVQGSSHSEIKERRDRVEDAVCAVREAIRHGALPGGGVGLVELSRGLLNFEDPLDNQIFDEIVRPALLAPVLMLFWNSGFNTEEAFKYIDKMKVDNVFDLLHHKWVNPIQDGLLDSLPAVREALRNSISVACLLGTCGGTVVFPRDKELERSEARDTADWLRNANVNEANERG